jgi:hypothetical protein
MWPALNLRIASILTLVQYGAHAYRFLSSHPTHGLGEVGVVGAMKLYKFGGVDGGRSYWDMYFGYGLLAVLSGLVQAALLWQMASLARTDVERVKSIVALLVAANLAHGVLVWTYFALGPPLIFDGLVVMLLGSVLWRAAGKLER